VLAIIAAGAFGAIHVSTAWALAGAFFAGGLLVNAARQRRVPAAVLTFVAGLGPWWDGFIIFGAVYVVFGFLLVRAGRQVDRDQGGPRR